MAVNGPATLIESTCEAGKDGNLSYTVSYQVLTDSRLDGPLTALTASGLPMRGEPYQFYNESDAWAFCVSLTPRLVDVNSSAKKWLVTARYEHPDASQSPDDATQDSHGDPIDIQWKISGSFITTASPARYDRNGKALENGVGELFTNPPLMKENHIDTVFLEKNTPTIDLAARSQLIGAVNANSQWGLQRRQIKAVRWDYEILYFGGKRSYVRNRWEFHISYKKDADGNVVGWTDVVLNQGTRYLVDDTSFDPRVRYSPVLIGNQPSLVPLDPDGQPIDSSDPQATLYYIAYEIEPEVDFASYGFPNPLPGPFV